MSQVMKPFANVRQTVGDVKNRTFEQNKIETISENASTNVSGEAKIPTEFRPFLF